MDRRAIQPLPSYLHPRHTRRVASPWHWCGLLLTTCGFMRG
jgi:hypothetical protein